MPAMSDDKFSTVQLSGNNIINLKGSKELSESTTTDDTVMDNCAKQLQNQGKISEWETTLPAEISVNCRYNTDHTDTEGRLEKPLRVLACDGKAPLSSNKNRGHFGSHLSKIKEDFKVSSSQVHPCENATAMTPPHSSASATPHKKSPNDFIFGKYIGEGSFSIVYLAVDVQTKREYAIKVCEKRHILREHKQEYIRREREAMNIMTNVPGFVNLSCTFQDQRSLYFVMTYAKYGDLLPYINKVGSFNVDCTRHYAAELVLACEEMHRRNVVHRDLKPENILLDENMHTIIADFGSAKILTAEDRSAIVCQEQNYDDQSKSDTEEVDSGEVLKQTERFHHKRRGSFVGTAQYVSPEVLQNGPVTPAADLWALGCIIYQMMSGLPPFRGSNDYIVFKEILACNPEFPDGFNKNAEDLVKCLLKIDPFQRLGAQDESGYYDSIRSHPFFDGLVFDTIRERTPPTILPYLPEIAKDAEISSNNHMSDYLEPGLGDKQLIRLLGVELGTARSDSLVPNNNTIGRHTVIKKEKRKRLEQQKSDKWNVFADNEVILKKGFINKRKGLFARKRMLLLTTGPRLIYIDPAQMIKKGEIPWSNELRVEAKNFKIFFVHTPNRTYYLEDPEGYSLEWVRAIENMHIHTYKDSLLDGHHTTKSKTSP